MHLDEEPPVAICEFEAASHLPPQHSQLMRKRSVLGLKRACD
jgi:hypothetical protein